MVNTLGSQKKVSDKLPFAMFFAVEPSFTSVPQELLEQELSYNPVFQINDESQLNLIIAGQTSTSIRKSTTTGSNPIPGTGDRDDDTKGDESQ